MEPVPLLSYCSFWRLSGNSNAQFLHANRSGSVGLMFALLFVPVFLLLSCAIDYSRAMTVRGALQTAADNATFAAIGTSTQGFAAAATMKSNGPVTIAQTDALNFFNRQSALIPRVASVTPIASVTKANGAVTATIKFTANLNTSFAGIVGIKTITVGGTSTASNGTPVFMDFYLLLDDSPSMAIGATTEDINKMVANTPDRCAFACHEADKPGTDYYSLARSLGVTTRMDVVRQATQKLFATAAKTRVSSDQFGMAIYTFDTALNSIAALTEDMTTASSAAANIDTMIVPYQNWNNDQDTNFYAAFDRINAIIPTPGTGASASDRQKVLFFVSDGVSDYWDGSRRNYSAIPSSLCDMLKKRGVQVAVLYTPYLPLPTNAWYNTYIAPQATSYAPAMQACASPGMYFAVGPNQGISDAMNALFQKVVGLAHLTK